MLVITRKSNQSFSIGISIKIKLMHVENGQACIELKTPYKCKIFREKTRKLPTGKKLSCNHSII